MRFIYSKNKLPLGRGGTERLEGLISNHYQLQKIEHIEDLAGKKDAILLVGLTLREIIAITMRFQGKVLVLKSATYSRKREIVEWVLYFLLLPWIRTLVIAEKQKHNYPFSRKLDLLELYHNQFPASGEIAADSNSSRRIKYGYVGRVDQKKGYFEAKKILETISQNGIRCMLDILIWQESDYEFVPKESKNLTVITGGRDKREPTFSKIENLILPYEDLSTTIAVPLVLLEACFNDCNVYTTTKVRDFMVKEYPELDEKIFYIDKLEYKLDEA